jgi:hypothetical protein
MTLHLHPKHASRSVSLCLHVGVLTLTGTGASHGGGSILMSCLSRSAPVIFYDWTRAYWLLLAVPYRGLENVVESINTGTDLLQRLDYNVRIAPWLSGGPSSCCWFTYVKH